ncbi:MAG: chaperone modulator CbpM [Bacteroidetes bacterium]|nr:chaperone modulator CbpM [Bacteroidota bacterium]
METGNLISAEEFCINHKIEISFISSLQEFGLVEVTTVKETSYIDANQLQKLEKILRLYYDLDINIEGIEAITHLLNRVNDMQDEIIILKNKLSLYEEGGL